MGIRSFKISSTTMVAFFHFLFGFYVFHKSCRQELKVILTTELFNEACVTSRPSITQNLPQQSVEGKNSRPESVRESCEEAMSRQAGVGSTGLKKKKMLPVVGIEPGSPRRYDTGVYLISLPSHMGRSPFSLGSQRIGFAVGFGFWLS